MTTEDKSLYRELCERQPAPLVVAPGPVYPVSGFVVFGKQCGKYYPASTAMSICSRPEGHARECGFGMLEEFATTLSIGCDGNCDRASRLAKEVDGMQIRIDTYKGEIADLDRRIGNQCDMIDARDRTIGELTAAIRQIDPASTFIPQP